jgi:hypothetical protein
LVLQVLCGGACQRRFSFHFTPNSSRTKVVLCGLFVRRLLAEYRVELGCRYHHAAHPQAKRRNGLFRDASPDNGFTHAEDLGALANRERELAIHASAFARIGRNMSKARSPKTR